MGVLKGACIFGQSGGPTSVINASACGVFQQALKEDCITKVYGAAHGIKGVLNGQLYDIGLEDPKELELLKTTPSSAMGSVRYKLKDSDADDTDYKRILEIFKKYDVRYFFYNGGNDSMDTCNKISKYLQKAGYECRVMGVPKTIDNDLWGTDITFGHDTAVHIATEALDRVHTTASSHHRVMVVELMGRYSGWIALNAGCAAGADIILIPEIPFSFDKVAERCLERSKFGSRFTIVAVGEGAKPAGGQQLVERIDPSSPDPIRLGGVGKFVATEIEARTGLESRAIVLGHVQRGGTPTARDRLLATAFGFHAFELLEQRRFGRLVVEREGKISSLDIKDVAGKVRTVPTDDLMVRAVRATGSSFGD